MSGTKASFTCNKVLCFSYSIIYHKGHMDLILLLIYTQKENSYHVFSLTLHKNL